MSVVVDAAPAPVRDIATPWIAESSNALVTTKDILKAINVFASIIYKPLLKVRELPSLRDRLLGYPILVVIQLAWKGGMLSQRVAEWRAKSTT